jgi:hypothetical protein
MIADTSFIADLEFGRYFEKECLSCLLPYDKVDFAPDTRFCDWDIKVRHTNGQTLTYEVKADRMVRKTGNFFIEIKSKNGKPSGLLTSKADMYLLIKPTVDLRGIEILYEVPIETMREFYKNATNLRTSSTGAYGFLLSTRELHHSE